jgi:protein gp37
LSVTSIEWTDRSVNPIRARLAGHERWGHHCEKVSPGCAHCYASRLQPRFGMPPFQADRRPAEELELFFDATRLREVLRRRVPTKWFWCDMTDLFGEWVPTAWIDASVATMAITPQHTHQIVTKRARRMREYFSDPGLGDRLLRELFATGLLEPDRAQAEAYAGIIAGDGVPLPNVWLIVSAEDQARADERIPELLQTPAAVRGVSLEPLLGPIDLDRGEFLHDDAVTHPHLMGLDWVVCGGESGPGARPCDVAWVRDIVRECQAAGVACFVKQLGKWPSVQGERVDGWGRLVNKDGSPWGWAPYTGGDQSKHNDPAEWPEDLRVREFPRVEARS